MNITWNKDGTITVPAPKKPKKITGTRFAAIMNLNAWTSPFNAWCAITRTYEEPFEDTIYTIAGKTIEPKQYEYIKNKYFWKNSCSPTDVYGENYFQKNFGDFFKDNPIFGGMWDYLFLDNKGNPTTVLEMKTTKRAEDWKDDIPEYYARQAALYAYLLGVDDVMMVCTVLADKDYEKPDLFQVDRDNTFERSFKVSDRYPNMKDIVNEAIEWWNRHVVTGISPAYNETTDADILKELRKNTLNPDSDIDELVKEAESLKDEIDAHKKEIADKEKRFKTVTDLLKKYTLECFNDDCKEVSINGNKYNFVNSRSYTTKIDDKKMAADGILEKYQVQTESYRFSIKAKK